jgi:formate-dependent phosphoribosylglycinamide formyltransferase (GAR transformylase)
MRTVVFVAPFPMITTTFKFARALAGLRNVRLVGVFQEPPHGDGLKVFDDFVTVSDALDVRKLIQGVALLKQKYGPPHRIVGVLENLQVQVAQLREHFGIPGADAATAERFRDKNHMKDELRRHGIPCARHQLVTSDAEAWAFVRDVGFPIVLKPPAGAGCLATYRVDSAEQLTSVLREVRASPQRPTLAEEFLTGEEHSFETITIGGQPRFHSISRYLPTPLEVTRNSWIQWCVLLPRDIAGPAYDLPRQVGYDVVRKLGLDAGFTHMEWFRRPNGTVAVGEIAMRPPGAQIVTLTSLAHDADMYRAWARAVVDDAFDGPYERKYAVGCAFLRGTGAGRVARIDGVDETNQAVGHLVVEAKLPTVGAPKSSSYEGDGYAIVRHPNTEVVQKALKKIIETVRVRYQ